MAETWKDLIKQQPEKRYDYRLVEKKIEEGFLEESEVKDFKTNIPEETEYDFSSHDELMAEEEGQETTSSL